VAIRSLKQKLETELDLPLVVRHRLGNGCTSGDALAAISGTVEKINPSRATSTA
jgi:hypothetical protein